MEQDERRYVRIRLPGTLHQPPFGRHGAPVRESKITGQRTGDLYQRPCKRRPHTGSPANPYTRRIRLLQAVRETRL